MSDEEIVMLGARGAGWIKNKNYHVTQKDYVQLEDDCYSVIASLAEQCVGEVSESGSRFDSCHIYRI